MRRCFETQEMFDVSSTRKMFDVSNTLNIFVTSRRTFAPAIRCAAAQRIGGSHVPGVSSNEHVPGVR